ncbi:MAG: DNA polymerase III subunit beta [Treponema sp.]|nr:DNA polymerase III subunit beta [Treponema sp.]
MKFIFDRNSMINEISIAQEIISGTSNKESVYSNVLFVAENNALTIKATDTRISFVTKIPVEIEDEGSTTIICSKLVSILSALPEGEIEFNLLQKDNQEVALIKHSVKKIKFQLACLSSDRFVQINNLDNVPLFDIPSKDLKFMINQTIFSVVPATIQGKDFLKGVYFDRDGSKLILVATNGKRLAYASKDVLDPNQEFTPAIVHPKILGIISKHASDEGNISLAIVDNMIFFKFLNYEFSAALIDGHFPEYRRIIPEKFEFSLKAEKTEFVSALKRISVMLDKDSKVALHLNAGELALSSTSSDLGDAKEEIPCEYAGEESVFFMDYHFLENPLKVMDSERIAIEFNGVAKAMIFRPEPASDYFHIIMPMQ